MKNDRELFLLWLSLKREADLASRAALLRAFPSAEAIYEAKEADYRGIRGVSAKAARVLSDKDLGEAERIRERCEKEQIRLLGYDDPAYPQRLREIYAPPCMLYVKGSLPPLDERAAVAVIGTRKASEYGMRMARTIAYEITRCGGLVVSGLTVGADSSAAEGALGAGKCIGVLGTPVEMARSKLALKVARCGALVSEYAPGTPPQKSFFRERNRIAAGISLGVVVVEAPEKSGTRFFVSDALEQGKDVFSLPGNADSETSAGTLQFIKDGARMVTHGWEVMEEYEPLFPGRVNSSIHETLRIDWKEPEKPKAKRPRRRPEDGQKTPAETPKKQQPEPEQIPAAAKRAEAMRNLSGAQATVAAAVGSGCSSTDEIVAETGLGAGQVLSQLTMLEIRGLIRRDPQLGIVLK